MVVSCSVIGCKNRHDKTQRRSFFSFPLQDEAMVAKWIAATGRPAGWKPTKFSKICSDHFEEKFINNHWNYLKLHPGAYPVPHSLFLAPNSDMYDHDYFFPSLKKESETLNLYDGDISYSSPSSDIFPCHVTVKEEPFSPDECSITAETDFVVTSVTSLSTGLELQETLDLCDAQSILPHSKTGQATNSLYCTSVKLKRSSPTGSESDVFLNISARRKKRKRFFPATCSPSDDDSPADLRKKLEIVVAAYSSLKKKHKTLLQCKRRLEARFVASRSSGFIGSVHKHGRRKNRKRREEKS